MFEISGILVPPDCVAALTEKEQRQFLQSMKRNYGIRTTTSFETSAVRLEMKSWVFPMVWRGRPLSLKTARSTFPLSCP